MTTTGCPVGWLGTGLSLSECDIPAARLWGAVRVWGAGSGCRVVCASARMAACGRQSASKTRTAHSLSQQPKEAHAGLDYT